MRQLRNIMGLKKKFTINQDDVYTVPEIGDDDDDHIFSFSSIFYSSFTLNHMFYKRRNKNVSMRFIIKDGIFHRVPCGFGTYDNRCPIGIVNRSILGYPTAVSIPQKGRRSSLVKSFKKDGTWE